MAIRLASEFDMAKATIDCDDIVGVALMDAVQTVSRSAEREGVLAGKVLDAGLLAVGLFFFTGAMVTEPTTVVATSRALWFWSSGLRNVEFSSVNGLAVTAGCGETCLDNYVLAYDRAEVKFDVTTWSRPRSDIPELARFIGDRAHLCGPTTTRDPLGTKHVWKR